MSRRLFPRFGATFLVSPTLHIFVNLCSVNHWRCIRVYLLLRCARSKAFHKTPVTRNQVSAHSRNENLQCKSFDNVCVIYVVFDDNLMTPCIKLLSQLILGGISCLAMYTDLIWRELLSQFMENVRDITLQWLMRSMDYERVTLLMLDVFYYKKCIMC